MTDMTVTVPVRAEIALAMDSLTGKGRFPTTWNKDTGIGRTLSEHALVFADAQLHKWV